MNGTLAACSYLVFPETRFTVFLPIFTGLSHIDVSARLCYVPYSFSRRVTVKRRTIRATQASHKSHKLLKKKTIKASGRAKTPVLPPDPDAPAKQAQLKFYEEALKYFQQQKFQRAKQSLERVLEGPSKELGDRAQMHIRICEQRISRPPVPALKSAEEHYTQGVALMNLGRWDEAREHLDRARKSAPKGGPHCLRHGRSGLPDRRSGIGDAKSESCHPTPAGKSLSRAQR